MIIQILGLATFLTATIQDIREQQVSIALLIPYYLTSIHYLSPLNFTLLTIGIGLYFLLRQKYSVEIGLGSADLLLTAPTILLFKEFDPLLTILVLYIVPVIQINFMKKNRIAAIPGMTIGFMSLLIISLI